MKHEPYPVLVDEIEDVGGVLITTSQRLDIRCGCTDDSRNMWGHQNEEVSHGDR